MPWQKKEVKKYRLGKRKQRPNFTKRFFHFIFILFSFGLISVGSIYLWVSFSLPNPDKLLERDVIQSTKIYDRQGEVVLYEIFETERRTMVEFSAIPAYLIKATIAAEDHYFYEHPGFSLKAIFRSILVNLKTGRLTAQGGSTITQQLIKNAILTPEKQYIRKIREIILAYQIERKFSKEEILKMYFNEIPYGSNAYGAEAASQMFFGKNASKLTLDEAALLAAVTKASTYYSPYGQNKEKLKARMDYVIEQMFDLGFISEEEKEQAQNTDTLAKIRPRMERIIAPHFVMDVRQQLVEKYGHRMVEQGGLKVITTLDANLQKLAEEAIEKNKENLERYKANNAALVAIDPLTGEILAMVGSRNFFDESIDGYVNVVTSSRQPGSSFKPVVYAKFLEKGYPPETILFDVATNFGPDGTGRNYVPLNYDLEERGPVTVRQALAGSLNIPAVKTLYLSGLDNVLDLAEKMGYQTFRNRSRFGLAIVLGGAEVRLLEHTAAFGSFAQEGRLAKPFYILRIEDFDGRVLEDVKAPRYQQVFEPQIARQINSILSDKQARSFIFGESNYLHLGDRPAAIKTGTTQNWRDAWMIGYTPSLVTGVWVGNTRNEEMRRGSDGSVLAAPIWQNFMLAATQDQPIENFILPEPEVVDKPVLRGELPVGTIVKIDRASGKLATDLTPVSFIEEREYHLYHSILHYVDQDDPRGLVPEHPENDPMYSRWEEAVKNWVEKQDKIFDQPPTEYDDLHTLANQPEVSIIFPKDGTDVSANALVINVSAKSLRGVRKIDGLIDNLIFDTTYNQPFNLFLNTTGLSPGHHRLVVRACDDVDNCAETFININLTVSLAPKIFWLSPQNGQTLRPENFPYPLSLSLPNLKIQEIKFYGQKSNQAKELIETLKLLPSRRSTVTWLDIPGPGTYELSVEAITEGGFPVLSEKIFVNILN